MLRYDRRCHMEIKEKGDYLGRVWKGKGTGKVIGSGGG